MKSTPSSFVRTLAKALILPVALATSGCAPQSRLHQPGTVADPPSLDWRAGDDDVKVTLSRLIVQDGPGSWVKAASWDEYLVVLANDGREPATVHAIELSSERLQDASHTIDSDALEYASQNNLEALKTAGLVIAVGFAGASTALTVAFMSAGWTVVTPLAPIAILVGGISAYRSLSRRSQDNAVIAHQLERRGLRLPATLGPGTELRSSAFFPITPAPTRLQVRYEIRGERRIVALDLKPLSGLHLAPP